MRFFFLFFLVFFRREEIIHFEYLVEFKKIMKVASLKSQ